MRMWSTIYGVRALSILVEGLNSVE